MLINDFLQLKIPWKDHVGFLFDASNLTKLAFERDFFFHPVNDRFCERDQAIFFELFQKLSIREFSFRQKRSAQFLDVQGCGFLLDSVFVIQVVDVHRFLLADSPGPSGCLTHDINRIVLLVPDDLGKLDQVKTGLNVSWMGYQNVSSERLNPFFSLAGLYLRGFQHLGLKACVAKYLLESFRDVPGLCVNAINHGLSIVSLCFGADPQQFLLFGIERVLWKWSRFRQDSAALFIFDDFLYRRAVGVSEQCLEVDTQKPLRALV